ncbi:MAG: hypothetical protein A2X56_07810 [Nitrospirae bacterium GWC2_57_13]|nr:MAG: hypothetical protein A2072_06630 [Nitrospirae bacterium GWC1_57_7]OGW26601.1 MAG: hypothetical protein A2X56_07810 [Nitrospirae bacterium GWC2_57_13]OGW41693.1 MAG: hypothetical protein A2X57_01270 [Nitrospirae bacterium GWD2_57_8]HAS55467.1 hypothetical protein [Nitrospiraceae bacterium]
MMGKGWKNKTTKGRFVVKAFRLEGAKGYILAPVPRNKLLLLRDFLGLLCRGLLLYWHCHSPPFNVRN